MDRFRNPRPEEEREEFSYEYDGQQRSVPHPGRLTARRSPQPELRRTFEEYCDLVTKEDADSPFDRP